MNNQDVKPFKRYQKIYRLIFWVGYVLVFAAAFIPLKKDLHKITIDIANLRFHFDQLLHTLVYLLIMLYFGAGLYLGLKMFGSDSFRKFLGLILLLAIATEAVQLIVPSRAFNFFDMFSNFAGILLGSLILGFLNRKEIVIIK
jgi:VanZ family protein